MRLALCMTAIFSLACAARPAAPTVAKPVMPPEPPAFTARVIGSGRPMILIPGLSCSGDVWQGAVEHYRDRYQLHVLTLAGFAGQPAIPAPFLDTVRSQLIRYIRDRRLRRPVIIGHSLGGFLAFWLGATAPDLVGPMVAVDGVPFFAALIDPTASMESTREAATRIRPAWPGSTASNLRLITAASLLP